MNPTLTDWIWKAVIGLVIGLILYAVKDWRKTRNENELAEETKQPKVKQAGIEALEAQILAMSRAWEEERKSKNEQIKDLKDQHANCRERIASAEDTIEELRDQGEAMKAELTGLKRKLEKVTPKEGI